MRAVVSAFLFLLFLAPFHCLSQSTPERLILTNVNVIDTRTGHVERKLTVVVRDGRIAGIAKVGLIQEDRRVHVINATGKYLIPGLWDMHVHSAGGPGAPWDENVIYPLYIANGVTGVRDMGGDLNLLEQRRKRIDAGQLLGPHMLIVGPFLDGRRPDAKPDPQIITVNTPEQGRKAVDDLKPRVDFVKVLSSVPHDAYLAVADEAAQQHVRLVGHVPESVSVAEASAAGQRSIEHLSGVMLSCSSREQEIRQGRLDALARKDFTTYTALTTQAFQTYDPDKARLLFAELANNNTYQTPTLVWWQANAKIDDPAVAHDSRLKYVPPAARAQWDPAALLKDTSPGELTNLKMVADRYLELAHAMHRAGVPFLAGTDGPDPYVFPGFSLHDELELLVKSGFTNTEALQSATYYPALFMAKLDQYGVIDIGRVADLVLLDANPLEDIRNTRKIAGVVLRGKYHSREDLNNVLTRVAAAVGKSSEAVAEAK
jgi:N-acetylglucosamine-6-phosphate deacetylase